MKNTSEVKGLRMDAQQASNWIALENAINRVRRDNGLPPRTPDRVVREAMRFQAENTER